jgi:CelD/BcsL family acetyltransferase involved in cellulose biosynthesis
MGMLSHIEVTASISGLEKDWRALQAHGFATPYQTYDWTKAWIDALAAPSGLEPMLVSGRDASGEIHVILPLVFRQTPLGGKALFAGGKHANFAMGLYSRDAMERLTAADMRRLLMEAARQRGVSLYHFAHQPRQWQGLGNPLALLPNQMSANCAFKAELMPDGDAMIRSLMSTESRKKLRHKEKRLGELGPVSLHEARDGATVRRVLETFRSQKAARFKALGISDPFADPAVETFLLAGALNGLDQREAAIRLYYLASGDRIVSVIGGAMHAGRLSGMFTSFDSDPAVIRYSPGDLLLLHLVQRLCRDGFGVFDLGTGDAAYKGDYCPLDEPLFDSILPMTATGQIVSAGLSAGQRVKRWAKHSPAAMALVARLRKLRAG